MPNKDGLQAAAEILAAGCSCKIVGLSAGIHLFSL